jgi:hypothetical protein
MDPALAGLIGVGVGGLLALLTEERRAWGERRRVRAERQREIQQAFRLVESEFNEAFYAVEEALEEDDDWWDAEYRNVTTTQWEHYAPVIAASDMAERDWDRVELAAREIESLLRLRGDAACYETGDMGRIRGAGNEVWHGIDALRRYRGKPSMIPYDPPPWPELAPRENADGTVTVPWREVADGKTVREGEAVVRPGDDGYEAALAEARRFADDPK